MTFNVWAIKAVLKRTGRVMGSLIVMMDQMKTVLYVQGKITVVG